MDKTTNSSSHLVTGANLNGELNLNTETELACVTAPESSETPPPLASEDASQDRSQNK